MSRAFVFLASALLAFGQAQRIERFELRPAADAPRLYVTINGEDRLISNRAVKAWPGWTPQVLIYAERVTTGSPVQRLRWYDAFTRNSHTIDTEELEYESITTTLLSSGEHAILIGLRDPQTRVPYVEVATPKGVFLREQFATYGTAANDFVEIRRYDPEDLARTKGDLTLLAPASVSRVPLTPAAVPTAAGMYQATLSTSDGAFRKVTLNLRVGGGATLISSQEGSGAPVAKQGSWSQVGADVRVDLAGNLMVWTMGVNGLTPRSWDRQEWGPTGVPLRRLAGSQ